MCEAVGPADDAGRCAAHRSGILNYYQYRISTGPLEGTNAKIRALQRKAYGFRDAEFSKFKIYGRHQTRYELIGGVTGKYAKTG